MFWYEKPGKTWTNDDWELYKKIDLHLVSTKTPFPRTPEEIQKGIVHWYNKDSKDWNGEDCVWDLYVNSCCMWIEDVYFKWGEDLYIIEESMALYHRHGEKWDITPFPDLITMMDTPCFPDNLTLRQVLQQLKRKDLS